MDKYGKSSSEADFSYGERELHEPRMPREQLTLQTAVPKTARPERSSDPYNTSGSFDRKKHWARIGKR